MTPEQELRDQLTNEIAASFRACPDPVLDILEDDDVYLDFDFGKEPGVLRFETEQMGTYKLTLTVEKES